MGKINSFLLLRGKTYYFNFWVPKDLRRLFGNTDCIRKTLRTSNQKEATQKARHLSVELDHLISRARSGMHSEIEIKKWVRELFQRRLGVYETYSAAGGFQGCTPQMRKQGYADWETIAKTDLARSNFDRIAEDADLWLQNRKIEMDREGIEFGVFCRELLKAEIQFYRILQRRVEGDYGEIYSDLDSPNDLPAFGLSQGITASTSAPPTLDALPPNGGENAAPPNQILTVTNPSFSDKEVRLEEAIEKYFAGYKIDNRVREKSLDEFDAICQLFLEITGNIKVKDINDDTITYFVEKLSKIPKSRNKNPQWRNFSALQLASMDLPKNVLMSETTVNKYIQRVSSLLNYCLKRRHWIDYNPAEGRRYTRSTYKWGKKEKKRFSYSKEEIQVLINELGTLKISGVLKSDPERFFIPLIALFSGMRQQEICQLYLDDIYQMDNIWVFDINVKTPDKSLKTESSVRIVPLHPDLISLGLLKYIERIKNNRTKRLWPNLSYTKRWGYRRKFSHWFDSFNRKHLSEDPKKVFHSFRHNFANSLRQDIVPLDVRESLLGHLQPALANTDYVEPLNPRKLLEQGILKLDYEFNLEPLLSSSTIASESILTSES